MSRISGPLLDRIDIHIEVPRVPCHDLRDRRPGATSSEMCERVIAARKRQRHRFAGERICSNARMGIRITADTYAHVLPRTKYAAVARLPFGVGNAEEGHPQGTGGIAIPQVLGA